MHYYFSLVPPTNYSEPPQHNYTIMMSSFRLNKYKMLENGFLYLYRQNIIGSMAFLYRQKSIGSHRMKITTRSGSTSHIVDHHS